MAPRKFHFISAVHSLYYVDEPESAVSFLYDQLEDGGKLLIVMQDGKKDVILLQTLKPVKLLDWRNIARCLYRLRASKLLKLPNCPIVTYIKSFS